LLPGIQLGGSLLILALDAPGVVKLAAFIALWIATFRRLSAAELIGYVAVCAAFSLADALAVRNGLFSFADPQIAGLPAWEFLMWGFYVLHIVRFLDGRPPESDFRLVAALAVLLALPFATLTDPTALLAVSAAALAIAVRFFHEPQDLRYLCYGVLLGAAFEYVGVWSGQWRYPGEPIGGVALWFVPMWGGVGLFARRLMQPLVAARGR
jgi:hypothetical protein